MAKTSNDPARTPGIDIGRVMVKKVRQVPAPRLRAASSSEGLMLWMTNELRRQGILLRNDERIDPTTQLSPPLVITREECDRVVSTLRETIDKIGQRWGAIGTVHAAR